MKTLENRVAQSTTAGLFCQAVVRMGVRVRAMRPHIIVTDRIGPCSADWMRERRIRSGVFGAFVPEELGQVPYESGTSASKWVSSKLRYKFSLSGILF